MSVFLAPKYFFPRFDKYFQYLSILHWRFLNALKHVRLSGSAVVVLRFTKIEGEGPAEGWLRYYVKGQRVATRTTKYPWSVAKLQTSGAFTSLFSVYRTASRLDMLLTLRFFDIMQHLKCAMKPCMFGMTLSKPTCFSKKRKAEITRWRDMNQEWYNRNKTSAEAWNWNSKPRIGKPMIKTLGNVKNSWIRNAYLCSYTYMIQYILSLCGTCKWCRKVCIWDLHPMCCANVSVQRWKLSESLWLPLARKFQVHFYRVFKLKVSVGLPKATRSFQPFGKPRYWYILFRGILATGLRSPMMRYGRRFWSWTLAITPSTHASMSNLSSWLSSWFATQLFAAL